MSPTSRNEDARFDPSDPAGASGPPTRVALENRVENAVKDSSARGVLVTRALDELNGALAAEQRQTAYLPRDLAARLRDVAQMRACLVEGLVRNSLVWELSVCTTALAVRYLDRFLGADAYDVKRHEGWVYHLVANACQSIAVKLQESLRVDPESLQRHLDVRFDRTCVLKMESLVLKELGWSLNDVVPSTYAPRVFTALGFFGAAHEKLVHKADIFALSMLYDPEMCAGWAPSVAAAAVVALVLSDEQHEMDPDRALRRIADCFDRAERASIPIESDEQSASSTRTPRGAFDRDAAARCVRALETFRDALAGTARARRRR